eukprot:7291799-Prorocentrum_lima.AAC.1
MAPSAGGWTKYGPVVNLRFGNHVGFDDIILRQAFNIVAPPNLKYHLQRQLRSALWRLWEE